MSSSGDSKNKIWIYAAAGVGLLVGAAYLFHSLSSSKEESSGHLSQLIADVEALGPPKRDPNGLLNFVYYKDLFCVIQKHTKAVFAEEKAALLKQRREYLRAGNTAEYRDIVKTMIEKEEQKGMELMQDVMEHLNISEQEFGQTHGTYMQNPQTQQMLMSAQFAKAPGGAAPKLLKQKTKEIFLDSEEKKFETMKEMMGREQEMQSQDPMQQMLDMMVEQAKLSDDMFERHGVDEEEFNHAMIHYNLMHDKEVQAKVMENMRKLGFGGQGMGGMGGF